MHPVTTADRVSFEVGYIEQRDRLTNAFRLILAIPHLILSALWGSAAEFGAVAQWFIVLFTGERNRGIWEFQDRWLGYTARVNGYTLQLYDPYPPFGDATGQTPTRYAFSGQAPADRLTNGLRLIWAIPALLLELVLTVGAIFVVFASWWVILFTGRQPPGMFSFLHKVLRYDLQTSSYLLLMTDAYPRYGDAPGDGASPSWPAGTGEAPVTPPPVPPSSGASPSPPPPGPQSPGPPTGPRPHPPGPRPPQPPATPQPPGPQPPGVTPS